MSNQFEVIISIVIFMGAVLIVIAGIIAFIYNVKLSLYLKKRRIERWEQLTTIGSFGPGMSNPFLWIPYIYNDIDTNDQTVQHYKKKIRSFLFLVMFLMGALLIIFMLLITLGE